MNKRQPIVPNDPDLQGATAALKRAARHARELAQRTGTPCWVMRDGRIVDAVSGKEAAAPRRCRKARSTHPSIHLATERASEALARHQKSWLDCVLFILSPCAATL